MAEIRQRPTHGKEVVVPEATELVISDEMRAVFNQMIVAVPDGEGAAYDSILSAIFAAQTWDDLNDPWDVDKSAALVDVDLRIDEVIRHASDYPDSLGWFLVCKGVRLDNKKPVTFAVGSVSVVAQLVQAFMLGAYPVYVALRKSVRPTKRGYYPLHLQFIGAGTIKVAAERAE